MSKTSISNRTTRHILLSGASALMLGAALAAGGAMTTKAVAATTTIDEEVNTFDPFATGWIVVLADEINLAAINAMVTGNTLTVGGTNVIDGDPSSVAVTGNLIGGFATGNSFVNEADIALINDPGVLPPPTGVGIGVVGRAINDGVVISEASDNTIEIDQDDFVNGALTSTDNLIIAQTTLNRGESSVVGTVPNGYTDATAGSIAFDSAGSPVLESEATISVTSAQLATSGASGSYALADGNTIDMSVDPTDPLVPIDMAGSMVLEANEIAAHYRGNVATSVVSIEGPGGGSPTFEGSVAVTNLQANDGVEPDPLISPASNFGSTINATIGSAAAADSNTLSGSLSVSGNRIASSATGNQSTGTNGSFGNVIEIAEGMNFAGPGGDPSGASLAYDNMNVSAVVTADLVLLNHQSNVDSPLISSTIDGEISAHVQNVDSGSLAVDGNTISSRAVGNAGANAILAGLSLDAATFAGTAALASGQVNESSDIHALTLDNTIEVVVGNAAAVDGNTIAGSSIVMDDNASRATAIGNQVSNAVAVGGVTTTLGENQSLATLSGGFRDDAELTIGAGATLLNVQANYSSFVRADNENTQILLTAEEINAPVTGSSLGIAGSDIEAIAVGSSGTNELVITAIDLSGSAGLGNVQMTGELGERDVTASVTDPLIAITIGESVDSSSVETTNNLIQGLAWGHSATNIVDVSATTTTVPNDGPGAGNPASIVTFNAAEPEGQFFDEDDTAFPSVVAAFGLLSIQNTNADVSGTVVSSQAMVSIEIAEDVEASSIVNDGNAVVSSSTANQAANVMNLTLGSLEVAEDPDSTYSPIGNVTNVQTVSGEATTVAASVDSAGPTFASTIGGDIDGSSASVSENVIQAQAHANRASNSLSASGNEIVVVPGLDDDPLAGLTMAPFDGVGTFEADAAFTVQNVQSGADSVSAELVITGVLLDVGGNVGTSSLNVDDNAFIATAYNNRADNALSLEAITLAATSGVQNFQVTSSNTHASTGEPGQQPTPATDDEPFVADVFIALLNSSCPIGQDCTFLPGTTVEINKAGLSPEQIQALIDQGWIDDNGTLSTQDLTIIEGLFGATFAEGSLFTGQTVPVAGLVPGEPADPGEPASKSVIAAIGGNSGDIIDSSVSVSGNLDLATAISNHAGNLLEVDAVNLEPANGLEDFATASANEGVGLLAEAGHALSNYQLLEEGGVTSAEASISLGIAIDPTDLGTSEISGSSLTVDGNFQQALAVGNRANSTIDISAVNTGDEDGGLGATSALVSFQDAQGVEVTADSWMEAFAPAGMEDSSLSISGNVTVASATINQVANASNVSATNLATAQDVGTAPANAEDANAFGEYPDEATSTADHALANLQIAEGEATSTAELFVYNTEPFGNLGASETGVQSSSVEMVGNVADARAQGNDAANALNLGAEANMSATGALTSVQVIEGDISATATGDIAFRMDLDAASLFDAAIDGSSVALDGNRALASAGGNRADNAINVDVGAGFGTMSGNDANADAPNLEAEVTASYALANLQDATDGSVDAAAEILVGIGLTGGDIATVSGSSVSASGNAAQATADGNEATNTLALEAGAQLGATGALASSQETSDNPVTATATGNVAITASNADGEIVVDASSVLADDNLVLASAAGNIAANTLSASSGAGFTGMTSNDAVANFDIGSAEASAVGSYALANQQTNVSGSDIASTADSDVSIVLDGGGDATVLASSVSASGNVAQARSDGNVATNAMEIAAGADNSASGALSSYQAINESAITATATGNVLIDASGDGGDAIVGASSLAADNNLVSATARGNNVVNTLVASSGAGYSSVSGVNADANLDLVADELTAQGTYALANAQEAFGLVEATATSNVNIDVAGPTTPTAATVDSSALHAVGNRTQAVAEANAAVNVMDLSAGAQMSASGAVANRQISDSVVNASAESHIGLSADGDGDTVVGSSSLTVNENATVASARGNTAVNALNVEAGAGFANVNSAGASANSSNANATYAVLNAQTNSGPVTADTTGTHTIALSGGNAATLSGSSATMNFNSYDARATGNFAENTIRISAVPSGNASAALASTQLNTGPVTATASGITMGVTVAGAGTTGSSVTMSGNRITASATGNSAVNRVSSSGF